MLGPITSGEHAIRAANLFTRLQTTSAPPAATLVKAGDDVTPFLGERNAGKEAWRVDYARNSLKFATALADFTDPYRRTFTVMLNADNGRLLFVTSTYDGPRDPDMRPMPSCGVATEQLSDEEEVYDGYPDDYPTFDFLGALEAILNGGVGSPFDAKESTARTCFTRAPVRRRSRRGPLHFAVCRRVRCVTHQFRHGSGIICVISWTRRQARSCLRRIVRNRCSSLSTCCV